MKKKEILNIFNFIFVGVTNAKYRVHNLSWMIITAVRLCEYLQKIYFSVFSLLKWLVPIVNEKFGRFQ